MQIAKRLESSNPHTLLLQKPVGSVYHLSFVNHLQGALLLQQVCKLLTKSAKIPSSVRQAENRDVLTPQKCIQSPPFTVCVVPTAGTMKVACLHFFATVLLLFSIIGFAEGSTKTRSLCPRGRYSLANGLVPCIPCPRGRYGSIQGLMTAQCTDQCPAGKYQNMLAAQTPDDCKPCPPNTYSSSKGLKRAAECIHCAAGKFNLLWGSTDAGACVPCMAGYMNAECMDIVTMPQQGRVNGA